MIEGIWKTAFGTEGGRWAVSVCVAAAVCGACRARRALTTAGALAAFPVGLAAVAGGARCTSVLLTFFVLSTLATHAGAARKAALDGRHAAETRRGRRPVQVLANGAVGTVLAFVHVALLGVWNDAINSSHGLFFQALFIPTFPFTHTPTQTTLSQKPFLFSLPLPQKQTKMKRYVDNGTECCTWRMWGRTRLGRRTRLRRSWAC